MNSATQAVIFDFDYTLADSALGIVACANHALGVMGLPVASEAAICRTIGLSLPKAFATYTDAEHWPRAAEFQGHFVRRADEIMVDHTALLPGVPEALTRLRARGLRLGIVTTKYRYRVEAVLRRDGLAEAFETVIGLEDVSAPKPDPHGLNLAVARLDAEPGRSFYVGDSLTDAETARAAGVPFAAVLSGHDRPPPSSRRSPRWLFWMAYRPCRTGWRGGHEALCKRTKQIEVYLRPSPMIDFIHPAIQDFLPSLTSRTDARRQRSVRATFEYVRDRGSRIRGTSAAAVSRRKASDVLRHMARASATPSRTCWRRLLRGQGIPSGDLLPKADTG